MAVSFHISTTSRKSFSYSFYMLLGLAGLLSLAGIVGVSLALGFVLMAGALVASVYALILYSVLVRQTAPGLRDSCFWAMFASVFLASSVHKLTGYSAYYILELCLILLSPLLLIRLFYLLKESKFFQLWFAALSVFFVLSILSSIFGRSSALAATYQFVSNLKVIFILLIGFYMAWSPTTETVFWRLVRWLWLPMLLLVMWQWGHPSSYFELMGHASPPTADPLGLFPSRAVGPFQHPSYLGLYAGVFTIFCVLNAALGGGRRYYLFGLCYFLLLLASTQRQEITATALVTVAVISLLHGKRFVAYYMMIGSFVTVLLGWVAWMLFSDNLVAEATRWGFIGHAKIQQPRQQLYIHGVDIANQYAPLGSGLGTFAGAGAQKYDISLYLDRGFEQYDWFYTQNVLMDTYWTNFLAEIGWGGAFLFMTLILLLIFYAAIHSLKSYPIAVRRLWLMSFGGISFTFLLSLTSPSFQDPGLFLLPGIFLGVAYNRTAVWKKKGEACHV